MAKHNSKYNLCQVWGISSVVIIFILTIAVVYLATAQFKGSFAMPKDIVGQATEGLIELSCKDAVAAKYSTQTSALPRFATPDCSSNSCEARCDCLLVDLDNLILKSQATSEAMVAQMDYEIESSKCDLADIEKEIAAMPEGYGALESAQSLRDTIQGGIDSFREEKRGVEGNLGIAELSDLRKTGYDKCLSLCESGDLEERLGLGTYAADPTLNSAPLAGDTESGAMPGTYDADPNLNTVPGAQEESAYIPPAQGDMAGGIQ